MCPFSVTYEQELQDAKLGGADAAQAYLAETWTEAALAAGDTVILLHPPPTLVGVSIWMERRYLHNDSLADG